MRPTAATGHATRAGCEFLRTQAILGGQAGPRQPYVIFTMTNAIRLPLYAKLALSSDKICRSTI